MTKKTINNIRATFSLNIKLFDLLKLASQIERRPMSHIVEQLLDGYLDQYGKIMEEMKKGLKKKANP